MKFFVALITSCFSLLSFSQAIYDRDARFHPVTVSNGVGLVVSQDEIASKVGADILAKGGNAVDAAVATGFALAVTFPQAGNIGGGGFMLIHLNEGQQLYALDYRETAPLASTDDMYLEADGSVNERSKRFGVKSAAVPGTVAGLLYAQENWGRLSRKDVLYPALELARNGFVVNDSLAYSLNRASRRFQTEQTKQYFLGEEKKGYKPGDTWVQSDLASTLALIIEGGRDGFYKGDTAELLVEQVQGMGGLISMDDLAGYQPVLRQPVMGEYRGHTIVSMPPPSSGGVHLIQMLNILENTEVSVLEHNSSDYLHLLVEAMKPAYADRSLHLGDPDFVPVPVSELIDQAYADELWDKIDQDKARDSADILPNEFAVEESADTTHYTVWDGEGNVVSNTYTLNFSYGNGIAVEGAGFLLNNEMDDFSAKPGARNAYGLVGGEANSIQPGKRPLSSMTPTIVLKDGVPVLATGSPGGSRIITSVLQSILNVIDFDMNAAEAVSMPRIHHQWQPDQIFWEEGISIDTRKAMEAMGHKFADAPRNFGKLEVILQSEQGLQGAADPRWPGSGVAVESE